MKELERRLKVSDAVIKYLTIRVDEELKRQEKLMKHRERRAARRPRKTAFRLRRAAPARSRPSGEQLAPQQFDELGRDQNGRRTSTTAGTTQAPRDIGALRTIGPSAASGAIRRSSLRPFGPGGPRPQGGPGPGGPGGPTKRGKRNFVRKKKVCRFCVDKVDYIDYKKSDVLASFIQERGKILPRRMTGTCARHQRWLTVAIKRAQNIALLPFAAEL